MRYNGDYSYYGLPLEHKNMSLPYVIDSLGGNCPVQAEGQVGKKRFYFRARWDTWTVQIFEHEDDFDNPDWEYEKTYLELGPDGAGWMSETHARACLDKAINLYLSQA